MKKNFLDKLLKITTIFSLILFSLSIFYYFVIFIPDKDRQAEEGRLENQSQELLSELETEQQISLCKKKTREQLIAYGETCSESNILLPGCTDERISSYIEFLEKNEEGCINEARQK